jgi:cysteine desulfuration protein SufE
MGSIATIEQELVDEFSLFDDWEGKYEYIIDLGKKLSPLSDEFKTEDHKIKGCQSTVWMRSYAKDGKVFYEADSDAVIVKGLVSMLIRVFSGQPAREIVDAPVKFLDEIGMTRHLAQTRSNGLRAMIKQMKLDALAWSSS